MLRLTDMVSIGLPWPSLAEAARGVGGHLPPRLLRPTDMASFGSPRPSLAKAAIGGPPPPPPRLLRLTDMAVLDAFAAPWVEKCIFFVGRYVRINFLGRQNRAKFEVISVFSPLPP